MIGLKSDFRDWYDHAFVLPSDPRCTHIWHRDATAGPSKSQQLSILSAQRYQTPAHGNVRYLLTQGPWHQLVVYTDEHAHRGEGKERCWPGLALSQYPDHYASVYVGDANADQFGLNRSYRHLWVGARGWEIRYESAQDQVLSATRVRKEWRSNAGDQAEVTVLRELEARERRFQEPFYAVDFVEYLPDLPRYAIDLNIAPGLKDTGMEDILKPREVYDLIASALGQPSTTGVAAVR